MNDSMRVVTGETLDKEYGGWEVPKVVLNRENVPENLKSILPLADQFGVSDDVVRERLVDRGSAAELKAVCAAVQIVGPALDAWLSDPAAAHNPSVEYVAFSSLRLFVDCAGYRLEQIDV